MNTTNKGILDASHPLRYTFSANSMTYDCSASWNFNFPSTGEYEIEVRVPMWDVVNRSHTTRYTIFSADYANPTVTRYTTVVVDQHRIGYRGGAYPAGDHWISLGRYNFRQGIHSNGFVVVEDAGYINGYVDPDSRKVLVDGMRWIKTH